MKKKNLTPVDFLITVGVFSSLVCVPYYKSFQTQKRYVALLYKDNKIQDPFNNAFAKQTYSSLSVPILLGR